MNTTSNDSARIKAGVEIGVIPLRKQAERILPVFIELIV